MRYIYHLSHIDLDGYSCQYLVQKHFKKVSSYNANYGPEVFARLKEMILKIEQDQFIHGDIDVLILITDLNITTKEANFIEKEVTRVGAEVQLLDHHITGEKVAKQFDWYMLDTSRSATLITYNWLQENYNFDQENRFAKIVKAVNAIDIWLNDDDLFEYGKVLLSMISGAREINRILFPAEDRDFKIYMIQEAKKRIDNLNAPIKLDDDLHQIKKAFFKKDENNTKDNLVAGYVVKLLTQDRQRLTIRYKGYKGILGYNIGNSSIIGNRCMVENDDYDFYMDINSRGYIALRSNNKMDVSVMASHIGNGGGHSNASGGKLNGYKDSFVYTNIRKTVQELIDK